MTDKTLKILLGIIAVNLTIQTVKDVGLFPTAYAQNNTVQKISICDADGIDCVETRSGSQNGFEARDTIKLSVYNYGN